MTTAQIREEINLLRPFDLLSVYVNHRNKIRVQTTFEKFIKSYTEYEVNAIEKHYGCPYELLINCGEIQVFCLATEPQYQSIKKATEEVAQTISQFQYIKYKEECKCCQNPIYHPHR